MNTKTLIICLSTLMLSAALTGCTSTRDLAVGETIEPLRGSDTVRLPGPSMLRSDGSVRNRRIDRPDGQLLMTVSATELRFHQVDSWARNELVVAAANAGVGPEDVEGWIRIQGPDMLAIDEEIDVEVYKVQLEIWQCAAEPRKREREVE
ncbi:MAG: hypothetical protein P8J89_08125 [Phycisphaerales bacterium]|nr:hypothetical protein [Phycisphaerales bacterium]